MNRHRWVDLASSVHEHEEVRADVCVVGAGAAGIYLAMQLSRRGRRVVLLEAGPSTCVDTGTIGFDAVFEAAHFPGASSGRFFGMGGSTSHWGGALVPHTRHDLRAAAVANGIWTRIVQTVDERSTEVLRDLGYEMGPDFEDAAQRMLGPVWGALRDSGILVQAGLHMPFGRRNLVGLFEREPARTVQPTVYYNAVANSWMAMAGEKDAARIAAVKAVSRNGRELVVNAEQFVVAAGAIESARILLEINDSGSQPVLRSTAATGCYLADHLSTSIADVVDEARQTGAAAFAPRFMGNWMRGFRFVERAPPVDAPRAFAHFIFTKASKGFDFAKEILTAVQARRTPAVSVSSITAGFGDLMRLAYARYVRSALYVRPDAPAHLQLDIEQEPVRENRVSLTRDRDAYGRRVAGIHWAVTNRDMANIAETARRFLAQWPVEMACIPRLQPMLTGHSGSKPHDAYHPVGTCRMGDDTEAVVDRRMKVWGVQNLWVSSTGILPSAGTANPTFTLLCLTHELGEHLGPTS